MKRIILLCALCVTLLGGLPHRAKAAISASSVHDVRSTAASAQNGGFYVAGLGGINYSQQDSPQWALTGIASAGSGNTILTALASNDMLGNGAYVVSGTNFTTGGGFQVTAVTPGVSVTFSTNKASASICTGVGASGVINIAGAHKHPALPLAIVAAGNTINVKVSGGYSVSSTSANVDGGRLNFDTSGTQTTFIRMLGYTTTPGDNGRFVMTLAGGVNTNVVTLNNANSYNEIRNFEIVGNATSGASALVVTGRSNRASNVKISAFTGGGAGIVSVSSNGSLDNFEISGGNTSNFTALGIGFGSEVSDGWVHGNAGRGVDISSGSGIVSRVSSTDHTGANGWGWHIQTAGEVRLDGCAAWGNAKTNFYLQSASATLIADNCIAGASSEYNWDNRSGPDAIVLINCAQYTSTSGNYPVTPTIITGLVTLSGVPWVNYTAGNFLPDSTAGEGAALRGVSRTLMFGTTTYRDVGGYQHQDSGGGGGGGSVFRSGVFGAQQ